MVSWMISRSVVLLFGTLYPAYYSYKAVKTKNVKEYVSSILRAEDSLCDMAAVPLHQRSKSHLQEVSAPSAVLQREEYFYDQEERTDEETEPTFSEDEAVTQKGLRRSQSVKITRSRVRKDLMIVAAHDLTVLGLSSSKQLADSQRGAVGGNTADKLHKNRPWCGQMEESVSFVSVAETLSS
ncbi:hypothetical protein F2P81_021877 [Scophthalmus maximus]|uniref:Uncharacterized protein n=1 Tax=Scophthalmus maximus TaxID=52904 RepID=A0A6A4RQR0_SCOMX|nr:hypothetical protein F2P81_021877 [Scophthalmus maximus]